MTDESTITVIDDKDRKDEAELLCKWAAARAGVIVVTPVLGTVALTANDVYMVMKIGEVYEETITEKTAVSLIIGMGTFFVGSRLTTLVPRSAERG